MKKIFFLALAALVAFTACNKVEKTERHLTLDLNINYIGEDGTKAVKSGWETGDRIILIFNKEVSSSYHRAELSYGAGEWSVWWSAGTEDAILATTSGTVSAVYVPFLSMNSISLIGSDYSLELLDMSGTPTDEFVTAHRIFSYYMVDEGVSYTVSGSTLSVTLNMQAPAAERFVHFYLDEFDYQPRRFFIQEQSSLGICSVSVAGYNKSSDRFTMMEEPDNKIYGYPYHGGYSFTCSIPAAIDGVTRDYCFDLTDTNNTHDITADDKHYRLIVTAKTLTGGKAIHLPDLTDAKWTSLD